MRTTLLLSFVLWAQTLFAQRFVEVPRNPSFLGVGSSAIAVADVDGDNDKDFLVAGLGLDGALSSLYLNDGEGNFIEKTESHFVNVSSGTVSFFDMDGDSDEDVFITGHTHSLGVAELYANDGKGNFSKVTNTPFTGLEFGSVAVADVDGDEDLDLLIAGLQDSLISSKLYLNNGAGNFSEAIGTPFIAVVSGAIAFADIDGDEDQDLFISGWNNTYGARSRLYRNDGLGGFTEISNAPFEDLSGGSIAFFDVDGDTYLDLFLTGESSSGYVSKIYLNDGLGNFSAKTDTSFVTGGESTISVADIDGDQDLDILLTGDRGSGKITKLYRNDGKGDFTEILDTPFEGIAKGDAVFADIDGDDDLDILLTGNVPLWDPSAPRIDLLQYAPIAKLFVNDGKGKFAQLISPAFSDIEGREIAFADIDSDNDEDLLITGSINRQSVLKLFKNDGRGHLVEEKDVPFGEMHGSSVAFLDFDRDGDQDLIVTGHENSLPTTKLYSNDLGGTFSEVKDVPFSEVTGTSIKVVDVNGDMMPDVLLSGWNGNNYEYNLYIHDGIGNFSTKGSLPFANTIAEDLAFADIDGDQDQDLLITSVDWPEYNSKLYLNDGNGNFSEKTGVQLEGVGNGAVAFSDVDGDQDQDLIITGSTDSTRIAKLYINNGQGTFTEKSDTPFEGIASGRVKFEDVDGDQDQDLFLAGEDTLLKHTARLYINNGAGDFTELQENSFQSLEVSSFAFSDLDGDNDLDLLLSGRRSSTLSWLYINEGAMVSSSKEKVDLALDLTLFPNPATRDLVLVRFYLEEASLIQIGLFDLSGKPIFHQRKFAEKGIQLHSLDVAKLPKGIYTLQLKNGSRKGVKKFLRH